MEKVIPNSAIACCLTNVAHPRLSPRLFSIAQFDSGKVILGPFSPKENDTEIPVRPFISLWRGRDNVRSRSTPISASSILPERSGGHHISVHDPYRRCELHDLHGKLVPYTVAWQWQKDAVSARADALKEGRTFDDALLLLQHPPVYTLGTRSSLDNLKFDIDNPPTEIHRTERGGEVTFHGPGQLVLYPIINLRKQQMDLHWYLRSLEEVIIRTLWTASGIKADRVQGLTGVWAESFKLAAIGVRVSRWIAYHGVALNVTTDLEPFGHIVPCGLTLPVGNVKELIHNQGGDVGLKEHDQHGVDTTIFSQRYVSCENLVQTTRCCSDANMIFILSKHLLAHFSDVFDLTFVNPTIIGPEFVQE